MPSAGNRPKDKAAAVQKLKTFMQEQPVSGVDVKKLVGEGRA